jgi:hypothetical protein
VRNLQVITRVSLPPHPTFGSQSASEKVQSVSTGVVGQFGVLSTLVPAMVVAVGAVVVVVAETVVTDVAMVVMPFVGVVLLVLVLVLVLVVLVLVVTVVVVVEVMVVVAVVVTSLHMHKIAKSHTQDLPAGVKQPACVFHTTRLPK